jgi:hypothetical protein
MIPINGRLAIDDGLLECGNFHTVKSYRVHTQSLENHTAPGLGASVTLTLDFAAPEGSMIHCDT